MKRTSSMNILGIDYGQKNIGLAWMQLGLDVVLPFGRMTEKVPEKQIEKIVSLIKEEKINRVAIGLPLTLEDGTENKNTERVRAFGEKIEEAAGVPVVYVDERLSSFEADDMGGDVTRDEKAAMVILETYRAHLDGGISLSGNTLFL